MIKHLLLIIGSLLQLSLHSQIIPDSSLLKARAPEHFTVQFTTTKGSFRMEINRDWSPLGADRIYQLIQSGFYNDNGLFRVQKQYVVQFGISNKKDVNAFWDKHPIHDEPVKSSNLKGTVSYARDGAETRTVQLFINMKDNYKLDTVNYNNLRGFTPVGKVISGFDVIESFYGEYGFEPANHQDSIMVKGNAYLKKLFPEIDYILKAVIVNE
jgi:peptidyl-prolyl cis-trans isomerase A (cyclophilin A)